MIFTLLYGLICVWLPPSWTRLKFWNWLKSWRFNSRWKNHSVGKTWVSGWTTSGLLVRYKAKIHSAAHVCLPSYVCAYGYQMEQRISMVYYLEHTIRSQTMYGKAFWVPVLNFFSCFILWWNMRVGGTQIEIILTRLTVQARNSQCADMDDLHYPWMFSFFSVESIFAYGGGIISKHPQITHSAFSTLQTL